MSRLSAEERKRHWDIVESWHPADEAEYAIQSPEAFASWRVGTLRDDHEALAAVNARLASDCAELKRIYASALGRAEKAEAENAALKAVPGDVTEAVDQLRLVARLVSNTYERRDIIYGHISTILAALNTRDEELRALQEAVQLRDVAATLTWDWVERWHDGFPRAAHGYANCPAYFIEKAREALDATRTATCPRPEESHDQ